jgi:hypothetical protein
VVPARPAAAVRQPQALLLVALCLYTAAQQVLTLQSPETRHRNAMCWAPQENQQRLLPLPLPLPLQRSPRLLLTAREMPVQNPRDVTPLAGMAQLTCIAAAISADHPAPLRKRACNRCRGRAFQ